MRSIEIIKELSKENTIILFGNGKSLDLMKQCLPKEISFFEIQKIDLYTEKKSYEIAKTIYSSAPKIPKLFQNNWRTFNEKASDCEIVISDHEISAFSWALTKKKKLINISHIHGLFYSHLIEKFKNPLNLIYTLPLDFICSVLTGLNGVTANTHFMIPHKKKSLNTSFFGAIVPSDLKKIKINHNSKQIFVYLPNNYFEELAITLKKMKLKQKIIFYCTDKQKNIIEKIKASNFEVKTLLSRKEFINDLAESECYFCHGGLSGLIEALYLKKPCFVIADKLFYERYFNGKAMEFLGYGKCVDAVNKKEVIDFLKKNSNYKKKLVEKPLKPANKQIINFVKNELKKPFNEKENILATKLKSIGKSAIEKTNHFLNQN